MFPQFLLRGFASGISRESRFTYSTRVTTIDLTRCGTLRASVTYDRGIDQWLTRLEDTCAPINSVARDDSLQTCRTLRFNGSRPLSLCNK